MIVNLESHRQIIRDNGKIHQEIIESIRPLLSPGNTGMDIERKVIQELRRHQAESAFLGVYGYPAHTIISINSQVVHAVPDDRPFKDGDVVTVDFGVKKNDLCTDAAFTVIIGTNPTPDHQRCIDVSREALHLGIRQARPNKTTGDIGTVVSEHIEKNGFHIVRELTGHGLGCTLHEKPTIYNYGNKGQGSKLKEGMYVCIEPIVGFSTADIYEGENFAIYMADGGIGVQEEHCGIITNEGFEIIV